MELEGQEKVTDINSGTSYAMVISNKGNIYSWGSSSDGKLGFNEPGLNICFPKVIHSMKGKSIYYLYLGGSFSVIATNSDSNK